jgi:hypothetical protein
MRRELEPKLGFGREARVSTAGRALTDADQNEDCEADDGEDPRKPAPSFRVQHSIDILHGKSDSRSGKAIEDPMTVILSRGGKGLGGRGWENSHGHEVLSLIFRSQGWLVPRSGNLIPMFILLFEL